MYRVTCQQCGASVITPDGNSDALACQCCPEAHSHEAHANSCPGDHAGQPCPWPDGGADCIARSERGEPCPGGHCDLGLADCTICRPCEIFWLGAVPVGLG